MRSPVGTGVEHEKKIRCECYLAAGVQPVANLVNAMTQSRTTTLFRYLLLLAALGAAASGCIVEIEEDFYTPLEPLPPVHVAITYEMCYVDADCAGTNYCEELALPAIDGFGEYVNAICTYDCFDDLDCEVSEFNLLPGACIPRDVVGGYDTGGICIERCEYDEDCDLIGGFACQFWFGERLCLPMQ